MTIEEAELLSLMAANPHLCVVGTVLRAFSPVACLLLSYNRGCGTCCELIAWSNALMKLPELPNRKAHGVELRVNLSDCDVSYVLHGAQDFMIFAETL